MQPALQDDEGRRSVKQALHIEDALIFLAIAALFVLGVFYRDTWWGKAGLAVVFIMMAVVFFFRFRRVHRAFTGRGE